MIKNRFNEFYMLLFKRRITSTMLYTFWYLIIFNNIVTYNVISFNEYRILRFTSLIRCFYQTYNLTSGAMDKRNIF